jgi:hypothetical protein
MRSGISAACRNGWYSTTLRAAVSKADCFDPELDPKLQAFCQYYGLVMLPTKPRIPRHKGKIERGIAYVNGRAAASNSSLINSQLLSES